MKGETTLQSTVIAVLAASTMFIGFGAFFSPMLEVNGQTPSNSFGYQSTYNSTFIQVQNVTQVFQQTDPRQNPGSIFDLTTIYIYQFANIVYNLPNIMAGMINSISGELSIYGVSASWFIGFIIIAIGAFVVFKIAGIIFRRSSDA